MTDLSPREIVSELDRFIVGQHDAQRAHYVRIWRNDKAGWRLLFDELLPAPPLKTPPVTPPAS